MPSQASRAVAGAVLCRRRRVLPHADEELAAQRGCGGEGTECIGEVVRVGGQREGGAGSLDGNKPSMFGKNTDGAGVLDGNCKPMFGKSTDGAGVLDGNKPPMFNSSTNGAGGYEGHSGAADNSVTEEDLMRCAGCEQLVPPGKFCSRCGKPLPDAGCCESCGKSLEADAMFCPHCGTRRSVT